MKRRRFNSTILSATTLSAVGPISSLPAMAQQSAPIAGKDYLVLNTPVGVEAPTGKIEVVDFFWYSCPHCNAFEPALEAWISKLPLDVQVRRVPIKFRDDFEPQQRLYYTLEALNKVRELHGKVFLAIHAAKERVNTDDTILDWATRQPELTGLRFADVYRSFGVASKVKRAAQVQDEYRVQGVPALGIGGRFYVDGNSAGTMARALLTVDHLIEQLRQSRKS